MIPQVSVVIPSYNRRAVVQEAIASVLAQAAAVFELIVVDDGSSDGTFDDLLLLPTAARDHTIRVDRIAHRGPAAARNRGVAIATAPLVAFLDSDDLWSPHKLARQLAFMREHPQYAVSQTQEIWLRNGRRVNPALRHRKRDGDFFAQALRTCLVSPSAVIIRTELFRTLGGFDESMAACEDYDLWLRVLVDREIGLLDEALVTRRAGHRDQLSAVTPALDRFRIAALAKLLANDALALSRREAAAEVLAEKCLIYAKGLARRGKTVETAFYLDIARRAASLWRTRADPSLAGLLAQHAREYW